MSVREVVVSEIYKVTPEHPVFPTFLHSGHWLRAEFEMESAAIRFASFSENRKTDMRVQVRGPIIRTTTTSDQESPKLTPKAPTTKFEQQEDKAGLLVSEELRKAKQRCSDRVKAIAKECRARNRRFR